MEEVRALGQIYFQSWIYIWSAKDIPEILFAASAF